MDANTVRDHKNFIQGTSSTIASIGLEATGKKVGGILVTPAIWALNYTTGRAIPSPTDAGIYATGFISAPTSIVVGIVKAVVDDDTNKKLILLKVKIKEESWARPFIPPCANYASSPAKINAMTIAKKGGTAWKSNNGLWFYITEGSGKFVADFKPKHYVELYRPKQPLRIRSNGGFDWEVIR
ncbi:MAG: hypothetical protein ACI93R_003778 [Flavobacteriales bacterium]|jgi:hypothetical protein